METIIGDDGLPADTVGHWAKEKHSYLLRYLEISRGARRKYVGQDKAGATYSDLFCATGKSRIKGTGEWIDGSAVAAWKNSVASGAAFTAIYISDINKESLSACVTRLKKLGAPVHPIHASATVAAREMVSLVNKAGLHLAFIDPYNLESLDFRMISTLAELKRIDLLIHYSAMDFQRNLDVNLIAEESAFDVLAPGWRAHVDVTGSQQKTRENIYEYWQEKVASLGFYTSTQQKLITGKKNQPLYRLLLAARHELANKFWCAAVNPQGQKDLF
jgi:three-Cys-motif partner protein